MTDEEKLRLEVENGFRQFDKTIELIEYFLDRDTPFYLTPNIILELQKEAVDGIEKDAGRVRTTAVRISGSEHTPPGPALVHMRLVELCEFVNGNWHERSPFFLSAYCMWRLNWVHPFSDGNGRTARVLSYMVLCVKLGYRLPGKPTIVEQIESNKQPYIEALEAADKSVEADSFDISLMESMIKDMLARQLLGVIQAAGGEVEI